MIASAQVEQQIRDAIRAQKSLDTLQLGELKQSIVPRTTILNYNLLDVDILPPAAKAIGYRANSLMDLYYFSTVVLGKNRFSKNPDLTKNLHYVMCLAVMKDGLKEGIEIPRDHFKSTVYSECFPMWRALPFGRPEEDFFSNIGFSDLYILWMKRCHNQDVRILLVSETIKNATKLGTRISNHYVNNENFRRLFFDILPTEKETWTADSLHQRRTAAGRGQGEGTFDFIGVGAALQSRHYNICVQDDLVGREARKSPIVMADTIDYHQILVGATDNDSDNPGRDFDEIVVGNRWSNLDLNSHIRKNEKYFGWTTHSALGGCCSLHPFGVPIFEAFTVELLLRWKQRLGTYHFSCQFLNYPIDPSKAKFNKSDLRYFKYAYDESALAIPKELPWYKAPELYTPSQRRKVIRHKIAEGNVEKDVFPRNLKRVLITDPRHSSDTEAENLSTGTRCRHALIVVGISEEPRRLYLLDQWAESCGTERYIKRLLFYALKWKLNEIHAETVGAQKFLVTHFNYYVKQESKLRPEISEIRMLGDLKTPQSKDAKFERIDNMIPCVERHEVWVDEDNCADFEDELEKYGQDKTTVDLLDCFGYIPQVAPVNTTSEDAIRDYLEKQYARQARRMSAIA